jgi:hypothetical protein
VCRLDARSSEIKSEFAPIIEQRNHPNEGTRYVSVDARQVEDFLGVTRLNRRAICPSDNVKTICGNHEAIVRKDVCECSWH